LFVATTPMVVFLSATLNPSGFEITSALALAAALIRLSREDGRDPWLWTISAVAGVILALSRTQGPLWILLILGIVVAISGAQRSLRIISQVPWSGPAGVAILAAILLNRSWEHLYGPTLIFDPTPLGESLRDGLRQLPGILRQQIGIFDYLEIGMPMFAYALWSAFAVALGLTALVVGTRRHRLLLLMALAAALALPVLLVATTMRHTGFGLQGRYVLPFSIVVPLLAGEILVRRYERLGVRNAQRLFLSVAAGTAAVQLIAWWANARRFAVGQRGPWWFPGSAEWNPPWGWWPWLTVAAAGTCLLIATALVDSRLPTEESETGDPGLQSSKAAVH
jgi:hypothetical protein